MVTKDISHIYRNKLLNTIETKPFCVSASILLDVLTMVTGWTLLILEVTGQRWMSRWASLTNEGCAGMLRFGSSYFRFSFPDFLCCLMTYLLGIWYVNSSWHNADQVRVSSRLNYLNMSYCLLLKLRFFRLFSVVLKDIDLKGIWIGLDKIQIKFEFRQTWPTLLPFAEIKFSEISLLSYKILTSIFWMNLYRIIQKKFQFCPFDLF